MQGSNRVSSNAELAFEASAGLIDLIVSTSSATAWIIIGIIRLALRFFSLPDLH